MYALCVSGAVNTQGFVWKFCMRYIYFFIHSCPSVVLACESLHVCTVCIWRCEHAKFHVEGCVSVCVCVCVCMCARVRACSSDLG